MMHGPINIGLKIIVMIAANGEQRSFCVLYKLWNWIILKQSIPYILRSFLLVTIQDVSQAQGESAPRITYVHNTNALTIFMTRNLRV